MGRKFCTECGTPLAIACATCGSPLVGDEKFCGECGAPRSAPAAASTPAPRQSARPPVPPGHATSERRLVSVLFADLVGFTTLSEDRDPEEVRDLLSRYFETCRTLVERYGGVVEKFIGDAVMAVWGTPVTNEDDAERAVRAALDLVGAVASLGAELGTPGLRARAGVLTGEAAVNLDADGQGMVAGDLVNTASRVQSAAVPGTVLVGDSTHRATESAIAYEDAGDHELKGKAEAVRLWRALRVTAGVGGLMRSEGLEPPFVGRDRELRLVKEAFHACVEERRAQLVQVAGIAGIGKSRLGWEFFKYMDGLERLFRWHRGRCLAYGEGVTYWALAEMVRGRAEIVEGEDRPSALAKLRAAVELHVPDPEHRRFVEPRLAHLLGLEERTAPDKKDLFAGWRLFFEQMSEQVPVIMVFEDLQWADPSLLEFIDYLLEWSRSFPIFVMTLSRPHVSEAALAARRNTTSIYLDPLPHEAMEQLLTGFVPGLPAETAQAILERAEGVPLYAVETVRMLLDRGLLVQEGPVYRPTGPIDDLEVPETLQALIAARLDGLGPAERSLVQDASVLGKTFTRQAAVAVSGIAERDIEPLLAALVAKEVLTIQADPRSPERGQYGFLQDLVRTVAYDTLAKRDRKARHLRVASYLEQAWGSEEEEIVEVVASHLLGAFRLAPEDDDAAEIRTRARGMLVRAAERAASLAASEEAESYFVQAAELTDSVTDRAHLVERAGEMAARRGRLDEAAIRFEEATDLFDGAGHTHAAARVQARLAEVEMGRDHLDQAVDRMTRAYAVLADAEADPDRAIVAAQLGRFLAISGRFDAAAQPLEDALDIAEHLELHDVYSQALNSKAISLNRKGRLDEARTLLRRALEVALEHGDNSAALRAYNNLGVVLESLDRFRDGIELNDQALDFARRVGDRPSEIAALSGGLGPLLIVGEWDKAEAYAAEAGRADDISSMEWAAAGLVELAMMHARRGSFDQANALLRAHEGAAASTNVDFRRMYQVVRSQVFRAEGRTAESLAEAELALKGDERPAMTSAYVKHALIQAVDAALDLGESAQAGELLDTVAGARPGDVTPYLRAHGARLSARLADLRGDVDPVEPGFVAAAEGLRKLEAVFDLAVTLVEHAEWLIRQQQPDEAGPLLAEAAEIFDRLEATPWQDRVARAVTAKVGDPVASATER
jgi:class 3 adenylate cyclase/tetratricopeptide (TPR) repeat protein